jgi:hypothetical protein
VLAVVVLVPLVLSLLDRRASSFRSIYREEVERRLARRARERPITDADLAPLPPLVQTYLRRVGVVGRPGVHDVRVRWRGRMRSKPDAAWMEIRAEQHDFFDQPSRFFLMKGYRYGVPFEGLHAYVGNSATMRVRLASLFDIVDAHGPEMTRSETVTLFNDMCLLAPATLVSESIRWSEVDERTVCATFTNAGYTITARLFFDADGDLVNFSSNDRDQSVDGKTYRNLPWSTPVRDYRDFGGLRLASRGDAIWQEPEGEFVYGRFELVEINDNVRPPESAVPSEKANPVTLPTS